VPEVEHTPESETRLAAEFMSSAAAFSKVFRKADDDLDQRLWMLEVLAALSSLYKAAIEFQLQELGPDAEWPPSEKVIAETGNIQRSEDEGILQHRLGQLDFYLAAPEPIQRLDENKHMHVGRLSEDLAEVHFYIRALRRSVESQQLEAPGVHRALLMTPFASIWGRAAARALYILQEHLKSSVIGT
jgi:hypothetical protein